MEGQVGAARRVGHEEVADAQHLHHLDGQGDFEHAVALIIVDAPLHGDDGFSTQFPDNEVSLVADGGRGREAGDVPVGDGDALGNLVGQFSQAAAQDDAYFRLQVPDLSANEVRSREDSFQFIHGQMFSMIFLNREVILSAAELAAFTTSSPSFS